MNACKEMFYYIGYEFYKNVIYNIKSLLSMYVLIKC